MRYAIRALSTEHGITALIIDALNEADARHQIEARGLFVAAIAPARTALFSPNPLGRKVSRFSLVLFSQELLALLQAGLNIVECLEALLEKESNATSIFILTRLLDGLREGKRLSTVLAEHPDYFSPLYVGIVQAAEGTSDLPCTLSRYIDYQQRIDAVRSKIASAAIYPLILLLVGCAVSCFLIGFVVPRFAQVYEGAGRDLPWLSRLLIEWGQFASTHSQVLLVAACLLVIGLVVTARAFITAGGMTRLAARLPSIGERVRIYELSRLYLTLGMMLGGGIPIVPAMGAITGMISTAMREKLHAAKRDVEAGTPLSTAFEQHCLTTPISIRMLRVGERSGELGKMLTQSATFYDGEIGRWIDRFTRTFEPLLMAAIGLVVGAIVVLLYMPIFDLAGSLS